MWVVRWPFIEAVALVVALSAGCDSSGPDFAAGAPPGTAGPGLGGVPPQGPSDASVADAYDDGGNLPGDGDGGGTGTPGDDGGSQPAGDGSVPGDDGSLPVGDSGVPDDDAGSLPMDDAGAP